MVIVKEMAHKESKWDKHTRWRFDSISIFISSSILARFMARKLFARRYDESRFITPLQPLLLIIMIIIIIMEQKSG